MNTKIKIKSSLHGIELKDNYECEMLEKNKRSNK